MDGRRQKCWNSEWKRDRKQPKSKSFQLLEKYLLSNYIGIHEALGLSYDVNPHQNLWVWFTAWMLPLNLYLFITYISLLGDGFRFVWSECQKWNVRMSWENNGRVGSWVVVCEKISLEEFFLELLFCLALALVRSASVVFISFHRSFYIHVDDAFLFRIFPFVFFFRLTGKWATLFVAYANRNKT